MNNLDVKRALDECQTELISIRDLINLLGPTTPVAPHLTKFSVIRACGTIELSFKALISDYCCHRSKPQVKKFINARVRDGSANPSWELIFKFLKQFDDKWHADLKASLDLKPHKAQLKSSLDSLVGARNDFAHGGSPSSSITDVLTYFSHSREIIEELDTIIG